MRSPSRVSAISAYRIHLETFGNRAVPRWLVLVVVLGDLAEALVSSESKENCFFLSGVGPKRLDTNAVLPFPFRFSFSVAIYLVTLRMLSLRKYPNPYQDYSLDLREVQREARAWIAHPCSSSEFIAHDA